MAKSAFSRKTFHQQTGREFKEEPSEVLHLEHNTVRCRNLDTSESRSEIPEKFWNVVPEKDGEDDLNRSYEEWERITQT
jgi:hypothetical protein